MGTKIATSDATATGDTTKTLIDSMTIPQDAKRITGVTCYATGAATLTTAEAVSGVLTLESDSMPIIPQQFPLDVVNCLTSGTIAYTPRVWNTDIGTIGGAIVKGYVTMDSAQTGAFKARFSLIYEV